MYIGILLSIELFLIFEAVGFIAFASDLTELSNNLNRTAGIFGIITSLLGDYTVAHYICHDLLPFTLPIGDTT